MKCYICEQINASVEVHHIIPQAAGGEKGPTIPLCSNCHSLIHRGSLQYLSKNPSKVQYFNDEQFIRAKPLIEAIVIFIRRERENPNMDQKVNLMLKPDKRLVTILHLLKTDKGYSNLNDFCVSILTNYAVGKI